MTAVQWGLTLGLGVVAGLYLLAVRAARHHSWSPRVLITLSVLSGVALFALVITDWPGEQLSQFWAEHSIFAAVLSTVLLLSLGYLAFEAGATAEQAELNKSVTSAGLSGLVDRLVDVDIALSLLWGSQAPSKMDKGRPLEWIRETRDDLQRKYPKPQEEQPKFRPEAPLEAPVAELKYEAWRQAILDQCVRRIISGMRDWAAVVTVSDDGRRVLKMFGEVRIDLLCLQEHMLASDARLEAAVENQRRYLQLFALVLEHVSSPETEYLRPIVVSEICQPTNKHSIVDEVRNLPRDQIRSALEILDKYRASHLETAEKYVK